MTEPALPDLEAERDRLYAQLAAVAALQWSPPLLGAELMASWRSRAGEYPDELVSAVVDER